MVEGEVWGALGVAFHHDVVVWDLSGAEYNLFLGLDRSLNNLKFNGSIKLEQSTEVMTVHSVKPLLNVMMTHKIVVRVFE